MFSTDDTIVAIATPPGRGGIGVVRLSGSSAQDVALALVSLRGPLEPRRATFTLVRATAGPSGEPPRAVDQAVVTFFPGPASYTGDDVVEISTHGSPVVLRAIVEAGIRAGARLARAGEFTLRAFLNGRIDLTQAEAVADLIDAATPLQARVAFDQLQGTLTRAIAEVDAELFDLAARLEASVDFPDEGYHFIEPAAVAAALARVVARVTALIERGRAGRVIREGRVVAIVGGPNVGKSSLFNALVGTDRAIVAPQAGTTRDLVSETVEIEGIRVTLVDTAGLRESSDEVEREGMTRTRGAADVADLVLDVRDGTSQAGGPAALSPGAGAVLPVDNKSDVDGFTGRPGGVAVSALTGAGLSGLRHQIAEALGRQDSVDCPEITNSRHLALLERALVALRGAAGELERHDGMLPEEFLLADLQQARGCFEEITGVRTSDEVLRHIFDRFCVGK